MGESSVYKSGNVSFQVKGILKSSWQPRFLVLYGGSSDSHPHMEVYESKEKFAEIKGASKKCDKKLDLNRVKSVNKSTQKSNRGVEYIIEIQCKKEKHVFSVNTEFESNDWDYRLNQVVSVLPENVRESSSRSDPGDAEEVVTTNLMYEQTTEAARFEVDVKEDKLSMLCGIAGKHVLCISDREIAFEEMGTRRIKYSFHFAWLRKFGKQSSAFFFECGRKCPNGEGKIECISSEATKIHDVVTSNSRSAMTSTKTPDRTNSVPAKQPAPSPVQPHSLSVKVSSDHNEEIPVSAPCLATNAVRKHPGAAKQPELIPIRPRTGSSTTPPTPKKAVPDRKSMANNSKRESVKKHGPASDEFAKQLEHKISTHPPVEEEIRQSKIPQEKTQRDLRKSKDKDKKLSDKEGKKNKEDRKSDKDSKKDKEEKKSKGFFSSRKKDKEEKVKPVLQGSLNLYEDPDACREKPKTTVSNTEQSNIYDEAISPVAKVPISEPVEYAQPYVKKGAKPVPNEPVMYSDAQDVQDRAWLRHGQEEEVHEEDYLNIKDAREMKEKEMKVRENKPPPLPQKLYDLSDDTYNTLDLGNKPKTDKNNVGTQNIYGTAGAKAVGKLDRGVAVPERPSGSESEGSSGELYEGSEEEEGDHTYEDGYEETVIANTKPSLKPKPKLPSQQISASMYEEIPSPPPTSSARKPKPEIVQDSLYDTVS